MPRSNSRLPLLTFVLVAVFVPAHAGAKPNIVAQSANASVGSPTQSAKAAPDAAVAGGQLATNISWSGSDGDDVCEIACTTSKTGGANAGQNVTGKPSRNRAAMRGKRPRKS